MSYFLHPRGICETKSVGDATRIWAFTHVLSGAQIGADCNISDHVFIENDVIIGDRVTVKSGVQLWDGVRLENDVFIGPNVAFANDKYPRSKKYPAASSTTTIAKGASIGAGAVLLPGIRVGRNALVGAGAVVTKNVPPNAIVIGNPARIVGYADVATIATAVATPHERAALSGPAALIPMTVASDVRGSLAAIEFSSGLPFTPERFFAVFDVPSEEVRGEHAHRRCEEVLICLRGSVTCIVDDGAVREEVRLDRADIALYMPAMTWGTQYRYSSDAVVGVFASLPYDAGDYIREYEEFLIEVDRASGSASAAASTSSRELG